MGRKDTIAAKSIRKMYEQLNLNQSDIFSKTKLLLGVYRDVVWITLSESARVNEELAYYGEELDSALVYLELFAPDTEKQEFESRISALFENKWMVVYGYEDDIFEQFHPKSIAPFIDPFDKAEEEQIEEEKEKLRQLELSKVRQALSMLQPVQRERLLKSVLLGISSRKIAKEEGINYSSVDKSIAAAIKNFKKFYENL